MPQSIFPVPLERPLVAVEFLEEMIGRVVPEGDMRPIGTRVEMRFWRDDEAGLCLDIYGPEDDRTRRFVFHAGLKEAK